MNVTSKGRYALRFMLDLAQQGEEDYVSLKTVADRQGISLKYLERILPLLVSAGLIAGVHGKGGGYKLSKKPEEYTVGEVLRAAEGDIAPVACLECNSEICSRQDTCRTRPMWTKLDTLINDYLDSVTIKDLMESE